MEEEFREGIDILNNGGIIIYPTDTVYGIACRVDALDSVEKIFELKKRDKNRALVINSNSIDKLAPYIVHEGKLFDELVEKYWPGKLSIIVRATTKLSRNITGGRETIGVRIPNHGFALKIMNECPVPIISTSANLSGDEVISNIEQAKETFGDNVDFYFDGGIIQNKTPSTVVDITSGRILIIRQGDLKVENSVVQTHL